jgi:twitching motility two-component system response regulator PilG
MYHMHKVTLSSPGDTEVVTSFQEHPKHKKLVVIIDDSQTVRKIVETSLGREGYQVKGFADGLEAMQWLAGAEEPLPDLFIIDIGLPKMDGYTVARSLKSLPQFYHTPFLMLTGRDGILDRLKGKLAGAQAYMTKPFMTKDLISFVREHLRA